ncbi:KRAB-A domain-containing protein [Daphnia sinensis]|uniref:KRAB-A domain-containing protein n=1 Tax=Daphnia sinensis TaxID=1820382 RepID=A0AAD5PQ69_9CRUS|nr:KRAB-A domain-containing protein [Daphnia sinensis]
MQDGQEHPLAYFSRQLRKAEMKYSTTEKEALAVIEAIKHFRHYLLDKPFEIISDHRPLQWLRNQKDNNGRLASIQPVSNDVKMICEKQGEEKLCIAIRNYLERGELEEKFNQSKPDWVKEIAYFEIIEGTLYRQELPSKDKLKDGNHINWEDMLDDVLFAYRSSSHSSTLETPYYLVHGRDPNIPINEFVDASPQIFKFATDYPKLAAATTASSLRRLGPR